MTNSSQISNFDDVYTSLVDWVIKNNAPEKFKLKKEIYFSEQGKVFEDDSNFEAKMSLFMDMFIFYYSDYLHKTPFEVACEQNTNSIYSQITQRIYSCFQVNKSDRNYTILKDLISGEEYKIAQDNLNFFSTNFDKKQIFQGFLFCFNEMYFLSRGLIFHPIDASSYIRKTIKFYKKQNNFDKFYLLNILAQVNTRINRSFSAQALKLYQPNFHSNFKIS